MRDNGYVWNPDVLKCLAKSIKISYVELSNATGISRASMQHYLNGEAPSIRALIKLADYFAVPLDYLTGRCNKETAEEIQRDYKSTFHHLQFAAYEKYLEIHQFKKDLEISKGYDVPWPYNLLNRLFGNWIVLVNEDQLDGLEFALNTLPDRRREAVKLYYCEGLTLQGVGEQLGFSKERARQLIQEAVRALRYPAIANTIKYGLTYDEELNDRERKLIKFEVELINREKKLLIRANKLVALKNQLENHPTSCIGIEDASKAEDPVVSNLTNLSVEDLQFSIRVYNSLKRAGIHTAEAMIQAAESGNLLTLRNLGRKSLVESLNKIKELTNNDLYSLYNINLDY